MYPINNKRPHRLLVAAFMCGLLIGFPCIVAGQNSPLTVQPSSGHVGIGITNPSSALHLQTSTTTVPVAIFENTATSGGTSVQVHQSGSPTPSRWRLTATQLGKFKIQDNVQVVDRLYIDTTGFVGIGIATPTTALEVVGDITATGNIYGQNKFFQIPHPLDPERKFLLHASLEGPEAAVYYRGEAALQRGLATIELPDYFEALTDKENRTVQLTPIGGWSPLYAGGEIVDGKFTVRADQGNPNQRFYWEVKAVRAEARNLTLEKARPLNRVISDPD